MRNLKKLFAASAFLGAFILQGCATAKVIGDAENIADTGKSNVVLLSYEIITDVLYRHPSVKSNPVRLKCGPSNINDICFKLNLPYNGLTTVGDKQHHRFSDKKVKTFKLEYGEYPLHGLNYNVLREIRDQEACFFVNDREVCQTIKVKDEKRFRPDFTENHTFTVKPGKGCYLGHLKLRVVGDEIVDYVIDTELNAGIIEGLPEKLRDATAAHVTQSCNA